MTTTHTSTDRNEAKRIATKHGRTVWLNTNQQGPDFGAVSFEAPTGLFWAWEKVSPTN